MLRRCVRRRSRVTSYWSMGAPAPARATCCSGSRNSSRRTAFHTSRCDSISGLRRRARRARGLTPSSGVTAGRARKDRAGTDSGPHHRPARLRIERLGARHEVLRLRISDPATGRGRSDLHVVLATRTFDLENDARLRRLAQDERSTRLTVGNFSHEQVRAITAKLGYQSDELKPHQLALLSLPLHLALLAEIANTGAEPHLTSTRSGSSSSTSGPTSAARFATHSAVTLHGPAFSVRSSIT
jgi:hypothetical protein